MSRRADTRQSGQNQTVIVNVPQSQAIPALVNAFCFPGLGQLIQGRLLAAIVWWCLHLLAALSVIVGIGLFLWPLIWLLCIVDAARYQPSAQVGGTSGTARVIAAVAAALVLFPLVLVVIGFVFSRGDRKELPPLSDPKTDSIAMESEPERPAAEVAKEGAHGIIEDRRPIDKDVSYQIIDQDSVLHHRYSLIIRLNEEVCEDTLRAIAIDVEDRIQRSRRAGQKEYERVFIEYYLPGMTPGKGAWAVSHFRHEEAAGTPASAEEVREGVYLDLRILGDQWQEADWQVDDLRTWTDNTGQFQTEARFLGYSNGTVELELADGKVIRIPLGRLSSEDLRWLEDMLLIY